MEIWNMIKKTNMTYKDLPIDQLRCHHTALARGYVSRKLSDDDLPVYEYHGRFGDGFVVYLPNYLSTRYCQIMYFIKEGIK